MFVGVVDGGSIEVGGWGTYELDMREHRKAFHKEMQGRDGTDC